MRKLIRKGLSVLCAAVMFFVGTQVIIKQVEAESETTAYLTFADSSWSDAQYWYDGNNYAVKATTASVTGNGQYKVALDFSDTEAGKATDIQFLNVEIANGEAAYPNSFITIDSLKINGLEVQVGDTYTNSDDGKTTRTNLYNEWVASVDKGRTIDGQIGDATATPIDGKSFEDITSIEVTFTLCDGVAFGSTTTKPHELPDGGTTAYLTFADNNWDVQYWYDGNDYYPIEAKNSEINGYGEYTVSLDFTGLQEGFAADMAFLDVEIAGGEEYFPNCYMDIKSVKINGEEVELGNTYTYSDDKSTTRTNLFNTLVNEITKGRSGDVALSNCTPTPLDGTKYKEIKTIECTFELIEDIKEEVVEEEKPDYSKGFNAFLVFADGSGEWESVNPGVGNDVIIKGDGVYEVSLLASQCNATKAAVPIETGVVFLIDIEGLGQAMVDAGTLSKNSEEKLIVSNATINAAVFVDGIEVSVNNDNIVCGDIEENGRFRIDLYNAYDEMGTEKEPAIAVKSLTPTSEIKVVFSLSGTGYNSDADTNLDAYLAKNNNEEVSDTTEDDNTNKNNDSISTTIVVISIVVVSVALILAFIVVVILFKKAKKK